MTNARLTAVTTLQALTSGKGSLASLLPPALDTVPQDERAHLQNLCYEACRWYPRLTAILKRLVDKPLKEKDRDIEWVLILGLLQLRELRTPDHAAISTSVDLCRQLNKPWAAKLVNAVLRRYQRDGKALETELQSSPAFTSNHPNWLRKQISQDWPSHADALFSGNDQQPPMTLRVNLQQHSREQLQDQLSAVGIDSQTTPYSPYGLLLSEPCNVSEIPGFLEGSCSVQDEAAQLAADLLVADGGQRILDACAAPGGKTGHILECMARRSPPESSQNLVALDVDQRRLQRIEDNFERLKANAGTTEIELICADALDIESWWDGKPFDRILLDAPCSATGVLRRHPDIKLLRKATDIAKLAQLQLKLLVALWPLLQNGGRLVYATCSIIRTENALVIEKFLTQTTDAIEEPIDAPWGIKEPYGRQLFPVPAGHDGFYYACLRKG